jgi:hypothetical protein
VIAMSLKCSNLPLIFSVALFACVQPSLSWAQDLEFHKKVNQLYAYEPHTLSKEAMQAKSDELDAFWNYVKDNPSQRLPLLRTELNDSTNSAFFFYDASKLLLSLSKEGSDQQLALDSMPKADLRGVQHSDYLRTIHWLARQGYNTTAAALRILDYPEFKAFIPQHALTLGQNYSLIYMLFPIEERYFLQPLIQRLAEEKNVVAQKSVLLALWYSMTVNGAEAIRIFAATTTNPPESTGYAKDLLKRHAPISGYLSVSSSTHLKEERRQVMRRNISDEALMEFDTLTGKLMVRQ